jgi:hypothetical protein
MKKWRILRVLGEIRVDTDGDNRIRTIAAIDTAKLTIEQEREIIMQLSALVAEHNNN